MSNEKKEKSVNCLLHSVDRILDASWVRFSFKRKKKATRRRRRRQNAQGGCWVRFSFKRKNLRLHAGEEEGGVRWAGVGFGSPLNARKRLHVGEEGGMRWAGAQARTNRRLS